MNILITGSEGFIGLALVKFLISELGDKDKIFCMIRKAQKSSALPVSDKIKIASVSYRIQETYVLTCSMELETVYREGTFNWACSLVKNIILIWYYCIIYIKFDSPGC